MASRLSGAKSGQNNIDRQYNMSKWLQFQQEQVEKRYTLEYLHRQKYSFIVIVLFNVFHIIYGFLTTNSLTQILYPVLNWLMIFSLLICVAIMYTHDQYIKKNFHFQLLIRLCSIYFYCAQYLSVDNLEMGRTASLFISSALAISVHMAFTNILTIPHWKNHLIYNFGSFSITQIIVLLCSRDSMIKLNLLFFIFSQAGMFLFAGFLEKFVRELWIHLDVSKKQSNQFMHLIDELPQPLLIVDQQCDIHLCNIAAQKFLQASISDKEPEGNPINNRNNANNNTKLLHRLNPSDLKVIENLINQVKETDKICSVTFQKKPSEKSEKEGGAAENNSKAMDLTFIASAIQWKPHKSILLQIQEAERVIEKEVEQKTITIEKVYEVENPQQNLNNLAVDPTTQSIKANNLTDSEVTSIQIAPYPPIKAPRILTQVDNVYSLTLGNPTAERRYNPMSSPNQSPINFTSPEQKLLEELSTMYSTQDNSEEVNINVDDEIYKHFSFIESGLSNLLVKIISKIQNIKGKRINLSFGSLENSPNPRGSSVGGSTHNFSGNKGLNISNNLVGPSRGQKEPPSPLEGIKKTQDVDTARKDLLGLETKQLDGYQNTGQIKSPQVIQNIPPLPSPEQIVTQIKGNEVIMDSDNENTSNSNNKISIIPPPSEHSRNSVGNKSNEMDNSSSVMGKMEYKFNEVCTVLLFDQSQQVRMNVPYAKYEHPIKFNTYSEGEKALNLYFESINNKTLFNFMILGIEATNGINGLDVMYKIRAFERTNKVPRTYLVASFNTIGSEIGGEQKSVDTYLFKGFDQAFEKPLTKNTLNDLIGQRQRPEIKYSTEEDYAKKYRYLEKFTILICDDVIQTSMMVKDFVSQINVEVEIAKSEKSCINTYQQQIESGKLYQIVMIAINSNQMSGIEIVKKIREYEAEKSAKKTYIVGMYKQLNETIGNGNGPKSNSPEKYKDDGFDDIIFKPLECTQVVELVERIRKELNLRDKSAKSSPNSSMTCIIKSPPNLKSNNDKKNISPSMSDIGQTTSKSNDIINKTGNTSVETSTINMIISTRLDKEVISTSTTSIESQSLRSQMLNSKLLLKQPTFSASPQLDRKESRTNSMQDKEKAKNLEELELKALDNMFNKAKLKNIQIEVEKPPPPAPLQFQLPQKATLDASKQQQSLGAGFNKSKEQSKMLEDLEEQALKNMFNKARDKQIKIEVEKPEKPAAFVTSSQQQPSSLAKISEIDEFDIFKKIKDKGLKFGGDTNDNAASNQNDQKSQQSAINTQTSGKPSSEKQTPTLVPQKGQTQESSQNSPSSSSSKNSQKQQIASNIKESLTRFDQIQKKISEEGSQSQFLQPSPPGQSKLQMSPIPSKSTVGIKQMLIKNDSNRQSPLMNKTQITRSPVQTFKGTPNEQIQILPPKEIFKYNEKPTFLVMEDSSLVMMNLSFMKYDIPKVLEAATTGDQAIEKYMTNIKKNILYHFIIVGMNTQKGLDGNGVLKTIRDYEKQNNIPRTYLIASFNSIGDTIGGQTFSKDTFIYRGFDDGLEKPIKTTDMNALVKARANPKLIYAKNDQAGKVRFFDTFTTMVCDDQDQISISLTTSSLSKTSNDNTYEYCWNGQSLYDKYMSSVNSGRIYSVILTQIKPSFVDKKTNQTINVLEKIRQHEKENKIPKTYIIGCMRLSSKNQQAIDELKSEGYDDIIDIQTSEEDLKKLFTKLNLTMKLRY